MASKKTVIVTGASQGIGAAVVQAFLGRRYNVLQPRAAFPRPLSRCTDAQGLLDSLVREVSEIGGAVQNWSAHRQPTGTTK